MAAFLGSFRERGARVEPVYALRLAEASQVRRGGPHKLGFNQRLLD